MLWHAIWLVSTTQGCITDAVICYQCPLFRCIFNQLLIEQLVYQFNADLLLNCQSADFSRASELIANCYSCLYGWGADTPQLWFLVYVALSFRVMCKVHDTKPIFFVSSCTYSATGKVLRKHAAVGGASSRFALPAHGHPFFKWGRLYKSYFVLMEAALFLGKLHRP